MNTAFLLQLGVMSLISAFLIMMGYMMGKGYIGGSTKPIVQDIDAIEKQRKADEELKKKEQEDKRLTEEYGAWIVQFRKDNGRDPTVPDLMRYLKSPGQENVASDTI